MYLNFSFAVVKDSRKCVRNGFNFGYTYVRNTVILLVGYCSAKDWRKALF